jgi:hypothetical protein
MKDQNNCTEMGDHIRLKFRNTIVNKLQNTVVHNFGYKT